MRLLASFLLLLLSPLLFAQNTSPVLLHKSKGDYAALRIDTLNIEVSIIGNVAHTEMTFVFYNDLNRVLEGQLFFPLNEGQTISQFAMDIRGKMRDGVVVEKEKGRKVFEAIVKRQIDPGLLEYVKGNNFKARVYPIPRKGHKRITIGYDEAITKNGQGYLYQLPLQLRQVIPSFSLKVAVKKSEAMPVVQAATYREMTFEQRGKHFTGSLQKTAFMPNRKFELLIPDEQAAYTFVGKGKIQQQDYFYAHLALSKTVSRKKKLPESICLIWDQSNSAANRDIEKDLALLERYFQQVKNAEIQLVSFNNEIRLKQTFQLENGNWADLKKTLSNLTYDGGTQLGVLDLSQYPQDEFLVFSDGLANFGKPSIKLLDGKNQKIKGRVITINSNQSAEHAYLNFVAEATGGVYINLNEMSLNQAQSLLLSEPYRFISATYNSNELSQIYPKEGQLVQDHFAISGVIHVKEAKLKLNFGYGNQVIDSQDVIISNSSAELNAQLEQIWANQQLKELDRQYEQYKNEITDLGKTFGLITRNTSLIVLDDPTDYVLYNIQPPQEVWETLCEQYKWDKNKTWKERFNTLANKRIKPYLVEQFEQKKNWYFAHYLTDSKAKEISPDVVKEAEEEEMYFSYADDSFGADDFGGDDDYEAEEVPDEKSTSKKGEKGKSSKIEIAPWSPQAAYIQEMELLAPEKWYPSYLALKEMHGLKPAFYADVADFFLHKKDTNTALLVASNLAELQLDNHEVLRLLGSILKIAQRYDLAVAIQEQVLALRKDEIQSYRDLALAYEGNRQYQKALETFYEGLVLDWAEIRKLEDRSSGWGGFDDFDDREIDVDARPNRVIMGVQEIMLNEMNRLIALHKDNLNLSGIDQRILYNMPVEMRVVVDWDSDNFDMDLWVTNPAGEKCYYSNTDTPEGGYYTYDNTTGYGPEEFLVKTTLAGEYQVQIDYYGTRSQKILAPVTVSVKIFTDYATANEKMEQVILRLGEKKQVLDAGKVTFNLQHAEKQTERYEEIELTSAAKQFIVSPDEQKLAVLTGKDDEDKARTFQVFDLPTKQMLFTNSLPTASYEALQFSADSKQLMILKSASSTIGVKETNKELKSDEDGFLEEFEDYAEYSIDIWDVVKRQKLTTSLIPVPDTTSTGWENFSMHFINDGLLYGRYKSPAHYSPVLIDISAGQAQFTGFPVLNKLKPRLCHSKSYFYAYNSDSLFVFNLKGKLLKLLPVKDLENMEQLSTENDQVLLSFNRSALSDEYFKQGVVDMAKLDQLAKLNEASMLFTSPDPLYGHHLSCYATHPTKPLALMTSTLAQQKYFAAGVVLQNWESNSTLLAYYHPAYLIDLQFSPQGNYLISSSNDKTLRIRKMTHLAVGGTHPAKEEVNTFEITAGKELAYYTYGQTMVLFEKEPHEAFAKQRFKKMAYKDYENRESLFPNIAQFVVFTEQAAVEVIGNTRYLPKLNYADYISTSEDYQLYNWLEGLQFSPTGNRIFCQINDANALIDLDVLNEVAANYEQLKGKTGSLFHFMKKLEKQFPEARQLLNEEAGVFPIKGEAGHALAITFFPIHDDIAITGLMSEDGKRFLNVLVERIEVYSLSTFELRGSIKCNADKSSPQFTANPNWISFIEAGNEKDADGLWLWNWQNNAEIKHDRVESYQLQARHENVILETSFLDDDASSIKKGALLIYDGKGALKDSLYIENSYHRQVDEKQPILSYQSKQTLYFYDLSLGKLMYQKAYPTEAPAWFKTAKPFAFDAAYEHLYIVDGRKVLQVDWANQQLAKTWSLPTNQSNGIAMHATNQQFATIHDDQSLRVWEIQGDQLRLVKTYFGNAFEQISYQNGRYVTTNQVLGNKKKYFKEFLFWKP